MPVTMPTGLRVALIGAKGMLAQAFARMAPVDWQLFPYDLPEFDLTDRASLLRTLAALQPDLIVNCAAYTQVDRCETEEELATRVNGDGPGYLAEAARSVGALLVHISTDYVFPGTGRAAIVETDPTGPLSAYGRSKCKGEEAIARSGLQRYFILRTSWLYGPGGANFVETILRLAAEREELRIVADQTGSPTLTRDLVQAMFNLIALDSHARGSAPYGLYHFSNAGQCSWYEFACEIVRQARAHGLPVKVQQISPIATSDYPLPARRPEWSVFDKTKYRQVTGNSEPDWLSSLAHYFSIRTQVHKERV